MPSVEPATTATAAPAATSLETPAAGFERALANASSPNSLTLGEMIGLGPPPPAEFLATAGNVASAGASSRPGTQDDIHPAISAASEYLGVPYKWGGVDPATGLDCSGLVQRAFADIEIDVPRVSADQATAGTAVDGLDDALPGDLVYWAGRDGRPNHIGIFVGGGQMLHAPRTGEVVQVADVRSAPPDAIRRIA